MKLSPREASSYFAKPDASRTGLLIYGPDVMRIALKRQQVIAALIGPKGEEEMRLARIPAADLRKDPAALIDAMTAQSFFPGPRVAFIEDASDGLSKVIAPALEEWRDGDAQIVVTAGTHALLCANCSRAIRMPLRLVSTTIPLLAERLRQSLRAPKSQCLNAMSWMI